MMVRCAGYQSEASVHTRALRVIESELGRAGIAVELTADITRQGRKAADLLPMVERGELDLCYFNSSYLVGRVPSLRALDLPFLVTDRARAYRQLDGALGQRLAADVAAQSGFRVVAFWDTGFRHLTNRARPLRAPRDCAGLRLRTIDNALHQEIFRALGFEPVIIDVKDLPAAVTSGTVDAQENPLTNTVNFDIHRTHPHVSLTAHFFGVVLLLVNRERFDAWPVEIRQAVRAAAAAATTAQRALAANEDVECLARLRREGCKILDAGQLDLARFDEAVAPIRDRELAGLDAGLRALL